MDYVVREAKIPDSCDCTNNSTGNCNSDVAAINRTIWSIVSHTPHTTYTSHIPHRVAKLQCVPSSAHTLVW